MAGPAGPWETELQQEFGALRGKRWRSEELLGAEELMEKELLLWWKNSLKGIGLVWFGYVWLCPGVLGSYIIIYSYFWLGLKGRGPKLWNASDPALHKNRGCRWPKVSGKMVTGTGAVGQWGCWQIRFP